MNDGPRGRVLVAVHDPAVADELFELGIDLASRRERQLLALVREASELAVAGALPFVLEVDRWSGALRPFDSEAARRAMMRVARDCERRLSGLAAARRVQTAMEIIRGRLLAASLAALSSRDVLLLGGAAPPGFARPARVAHRRIGVVTGDGGGDESAFELARELLGDATRAAASIVPIPADGQFAQATREEIGFLVLSRLRADEDTAALQRYLCAPGRCVLVTGG